MKQNNGSGPWDISAMRFEESDYVGKVHALLADSIRLRASTLRYWKLEKRCSFVI